MKIIFLTSIFVTLVLAVVGSESSSGPVYRPGSIRQCLKQAKQVNSNGTCDPVKSNKHFTECMCKYLSDKNVCPPLALTVIMTEGLMDEKSGGKGLLSIIINLLAGLLSGTLNYALPNLLDGLLGAVNSTLGGTGDLVDEVVETVSDLVNSTLGGTGDLVDEVGETVSDLVNNATGTLNNTLNSTVDTLTGVLGGLLGV